MNSASFAADFGLKVQGDTAKMTDPTAKALLSQGVTLHAEGASANEPTAVDMTMSLGIAGQTLEFGMMSEGTKSWLEYQGTWYALDAKNAKALDKQAADRRRAHRAAQEPGGRPLELGHGATSWSAPRSVNGSVEVYHVKAAADPQKLAESLTKAAEDPSLADKLGGSGSELGQLSQGLTQNKQQAEELSKSLKDATVDYWIGVDDQLMYKAQFAAALDTTGQKDMAGRRRRDHEGTRDHGRLRRAGRRSRRRPTRSRSRSS